MQWARRRTIVPKVVTTNKKVRFYRLTGTLQPRVQHNAESNSFKQVQPHLWQFILIQVCCVLFSVIDVFNLFVSYSQDLCGRTESCKYGFIGVRMSLVVNIKKKMCQFTANVDMNNTVIISLMAIKNLCRTSCNQSISLCLLLWKFDFR